MLENCLSMVFAVEVEFSFLSFKNLCFPLFWVSIVLWCSHILGFVFSSKDLRKQFVFSNFYWANIKDPYWIVRGGGRKFSIPANFPDLLNPPLLFPFSRLLVLQRGSPVQGHDATSPSSVCFLVKLMLREPCSLWKNQADSWHEAPALWELRGILPWLLWMTQGKCGKASSALCAWRTCNHSISFRHIMRKSTPGKTMMSKGKLKVRGEDLGLSHSVSGSFNSWDNFH